MSTCLHVHLLAHVHVDLGEGSWASERLTRRADPPATSSPRGHCLFVAKGHLEGSEATPRSEGMQGISSWRAYRAVAWRLAVSRTTMMPAVAAARFDSSIIVKLHMQHKSTSEGPEPQHSSWDQDSWGQCAGSRGTRSNHSGLLFQERKGGVLYYFYFFLCGRVGAYACADVVVAWVVASGGVELALGAGGVCAGHGSVVWA